MSRYAQVGAGKKRDAAEPDVIEALTKAGWHVWQELPVDLLAWRPDKGFVVLEVKTGKSKTRKGQEKQANFLSTTGAPTVRNAREALMATGDISLKARGSVNVP